MIIKLHFKSGKEILTSHPVNEPFKAFVNKLYKNDVYIFDDVSVRVSEIEYVELVCYDEKH